MTTPTEPTRWKSPYRDADDYRWNRQYDARNGVREVIRGILTDASDREVFGNRRRIVDRIQDALGAVAPERRAVLADTLVDTYEAWLAVYRAGAGPAASVEAHRPFGRLLDEAAFAQIAGVRFLFAASAA